MAYVRQIAGFSTGMFLAVFCFCGASALADIADLGQDGWFAWQIPAVESAPEMCCYTWQLGSPKRMQCNLDSGNNRFNFTRDQFPASDDVRIYVRMDSGLVSKIRAFGAQCEVTATTAITNLDSVDADESVAWLEARIENGTRLSSAAIAAIGMHGITRARDVLLDTSTTGKHQDDREEAIFWMALTRVEEMASTLRKFMFEDRNPKIREHAAFSYAQSIASDINDMLIRQGQNDKDPDVRSQAWFWLAQTGAEESEAAIHNAVLNDHDAGVREEAVFALSQLPEEQSVRALVRLLRDRQLDMDTRKQALFWLAQSDTDEAFDAIDRLLSHN